MDNIKRNSLLISIIGIVIIFIIISIFRENDNTIPNYVSVIGTVCSLIGLTITYIQVTLLKETSEITNTKIEETLKKVNQVNSISELSKAIKTNQEIQTFIRNGKIELAHLRTLDLKYILLNFNNNHHFIEFTENRDYQILIVDFGIDLNSINDFLIYPKRKVDFSKITNNLENLSTFLTQFEVQLKTSL